MNTETKKYLRDYTLEELKELPERKWDIETAYTSLLIYPSGSEHDSGWSCITVIGVRDLVPVEKLTTYSDDLNFKVCNAASFAGYIYPQFHIDCVPAAGAMHYWSRENKFVVGTSLSSIDIFVQPK